MFVEPIKDEGLAHISYVVGDANQAAVIDPRRDCECYLRIAEERGVTITHIFETHRNEDFVHGSLDLAERTGAAVHHGAALDFRYGRPAREGDYFEVGDVGFKVLETPGHTDESLSFAVIDNSTGELPIGVFTGDALFVGDVGRTDFYPDRAREVAGLLYDSIFGKILPLGDQTVLYPAHGSGSVCGSGMADRDFSTLGYERNTNPMLQLGREAFIQAKLDEHHEMPPYFREMERLNLEGPPARPHRTQAHRFSPIELDDARSDGLQVLDVREPEAFCGAHIPGALGIPVNMLPSFAGWFLDYHRPIVVVSEDAEGYAEAVRHLSRLGYDRVLGYLGGGMTAWETAAKPYNRTPAVSAAEVRSWAEEGRPFTVLDVRALDEYDSGHVPGARHRYVGEVVDEVPQLPRGEPVVTFCGSGRRAAIAASALERAGVSRLRNCFGSMAAYRNLDGPVDAR